MPTPTWSAARNGLPGDANAVDKSAQVNQFLGTHGVTPVYAGSQVVTPNGLGTGSNDPASFWAFHLDQFDYDQPFTMSGTTVGRVMIPLLPVGTGADLTVSLCADSAGSPGTVLASARIPAQWITAMAGTSGLAGTSTSLQLATNTNPLALPQYNTLQSGVWTTVVGALPATSATGNPSPTTINSGNYMVLAGGTDSVSGAEIANVFTIPFLGGTALGPPVPQPSMPQVSNQVIVAATADTLVVAGGEAGASRYANVFTAAWNINTGQASSWTAQASLPQSVYAAGTAVWNETVYVIGGANSANQAIATVYYATIQNGQLQTWNTGPALPIATIDPMTFVVGNTLIAAGVGSTTAVYYLPINPDGSLGGSWQPGPPLLLATSGLISGYTTNGIIHVGSAEVQVLQADFSGLGSWSEQTSPGQAQPGLFPIGPGQWQMFLVAATNYKTATFYATPRISVPLPVTSLTNGTTYHVLMQQQGGDVNNYLRTVADGNALPGNPTALYRTKGGGSWTAYGAGYAIPISVYDQTRGGPPWHTWEDSGARITTLAYATTPDQRLLGIADSAAFIDGTRTASVRTVDYNGTWPSGIWPPIGVGKNPA